MSPLNSRTDTKVAANSVLTFGGILFTPIRLFGVAYWNCRTLEGQAFIQEPECTLSTS